MARTASVVAMGWAKRCWATISATGSRGSSGCGAASVSASSAASSASPKRAATAGARQLRHLAHALQPGAAQGDLHRFLIGQGGQRQIDKARLAEAGQRHRGGRRGGQRVAGGKAEPVQPRQHVGDQAGLPAEQVGTASNVDH